MKSSHSGEETIFKIFFFHVNFSYCCPVRANYSIFATKTFYLYWPLYFCFILSNISESSVGRVVWDNTMEGQMLLTLAWGWNGTLLLAHHPAQASSAPRQETGLFLATIPLLWFLLFFNFIKESQIFSQIYKNNKFSRNYFKISKISVKMILPWDSQRHIKEASL